MLADSAPRGTEGVGWPGSGVVLAIDGRAVSVCFIPDAWPLLTGDRDLRTCPSGRRCRGGRVGVGHVFGAVVVVRQRISLLDLFCRCGCVSVVAFKGDLRRIGVL